MLGVWGSGRVTVGGGRVRVGARVSGARVRVRLGLGKG
jgi:hypothetical protein